MYQVIIKGRNLVELKKAVSDIDSELNGGLVSGIEKELEEAKRTEEIVKSPEAVQSLNKVADEFSQAVKQQIVEEHVFVAPIDKGVVDIVAGPVLTSSIIEQPVQVRNDLELDVQGIPHDIRIHASSKAKVANGSWRNKRGVDPKLLAEVTAELKAAYLKVGVIEEKMIHVQAPVVAPVMQVAQAIVEVAVAQPVVVAPVVAAVVAPVLNMATGHTVDTFKENFAMIVASLITEKKITQDYVNQLLQHFKVDAIYNIDDAQKEELFASFVSFGLIQAV